MHVDNITFKISAGLKLELSILKQNGL